MTTSGEANVGATVPSAGAGADFAPFLPDRYVDHGRVGLGGMSEVRRVTDRVLDRVVAMKIDLVDGRTGASVSDAVGEARLAARLQHPGVVAVYDAGELADGRRYVTMPFVDGTTLEDWLERIHPLAEAARVVLSVAEVLAVAHGMGLVHRDVTPRNVLLGTRGEVRLGDWGISAAVGSRPGAAGTRGFSRDAQLAGEPADPRDDVFAFGRVLSRVLDRCSTRDDALDALAARCVALDVDVAGAVAVLRAVVDGRGRRDRADSLVGEAFAAFADASALDTSARRATARSDRWHRRLAPYVAGWRRDRAAGLASRARALVRRARDLDELALNKLRAASEVDPGHVAAGDALAEALVGRLRAAERDADPARLTTLAAELRWRAPARFDTWNHEPASLALATDPPDVPVVARAIDVGDGRYVLGPPRALGVTPIDGQPMPAGRFLLEVSPPGGAKVAYPVVLERGTCHVDRHPTDGVVTLQIPAGLGADDCLVPGGWFRCGGDPLAIDGFRALRIWVDTFVIRRFPVTVDEYRSFLADLPDDEADVRRPRELGAGEVGPVRGPDGAWICGCDPRDPVTGVSHGDATAFAAWQAARTGLPWRLLHELEWEKAARGTDGRLVPWGDLFEGPWANWPRSRKTPPGRLPVDTFPTDVSVYGVRGLAGNVRDWCANGWADSPRDGDVCPPPSTTGIRVVRGGFWGVAPRNTTAAARFGAEPSFSHRVIGFRLGRSV